MPAKRRILARLPTRDPPTLTNDFVNRGRFKVVMRRKKKPVNGRPGGVASAGPPGKDGRGERNL